MRHIASGDHHVGSEDTGKVGAQTVDERMLARSGDKHPPDTGLAESGHELKRPFHARRFGILVEIYRLAPVEFLYLVGRGIAVVGAAKQQIDG